MHSRNTHIDAVGATGAPHLWIYFLSSSSVYDCVRWGKYLSLLSDVVHPYLSGYQTTRMKKEKQEGERGEHNSQAVGR